MVTPQLTVPDTRTGMPRVQLGINVGNIDEAVAFYSKLFGVEPHKRRPGYANFAVTSPPLKLVLFENSAAAGTLNHLGVEVADVAGVDAARSRFEAADLTSRDEDGVCCYADQSKVWVTDPDGTGWEYYTITDDDPANATLELSSSSCCGGESTCCA